MENTKLNKMTNHKPDGLKSKVMKLSPKFFKMDLEEGSMYLPYCNFGHHRGLIKDEDVCQSRNCQYYIKLYLNKKL